MTKPATATLADLAVGRIRVAQPQRRYFTEIIRSMRLRFPW